MTVNLDPLIIKNLYSKEKLTIKEVANKLNIPFWTLYGFMLRNNLDRRNCSEANYLVNSLKPQFKIKSKLNSTDEKLKIAGVMLYWAEGTLKGNTVDFANSNPEMIRVFLKFLREICGAREERLRIYLYAYDYQDIVILKNYWSKITNIPLNKFTKPYIRKGNPNISGRRLAYGLIHVRYNDKRLLKQINN